MEMVLEEIGEYEKLLKYQTSVLGEMG